MQYKIINLSTLEEINVQEENNYFNFIGKKNKFINNITNLKLQKNDTRLTYLYFSDYEFYIPRNMINNSCLVFIDKYTLLINMYRYKNRLIVLRLENNLAFKIYYQRLIELRNIGMNTNNIIFDNLKDKANGYERILINYCFEVLDNCENKDKKILVNALLFLINPTFKLHTKVEFIKTIEGPCSNLQDSIYGIKYDLIGNIASILKKLGSNIVYENGAVNLNKTLDIFTNYIIKFYNYEYERDYPKKYKCFID